MMRIACFKDHYHDQRAFLVDLEARGVKSAAVGARLRIDASAGTLTPRTTYASLNTSSSARPTWLLPATSRS